MIKDLVYEVRHGHIGTIEGKSLEVTNRMRSKKYKKIMKDAMRLTDTLERAVDLNYPEMKKARLTIEFE